jgi:hypothetical protein
MGNELLIIDRSYTLLPVQIAAAGDQAARRFIEFFTANIRNPNTRTAYLRAVSDFFGWTDRVGLKRLETLEPVHVAAYIEQLGKTHSAPSVKQHLAALRMLFDWLVVGQVVPSNPVSVVRGPKHVVKQGKTPILSPEEAHELFASIPTETVVGLRDRALIGVLIYSFARAQRRLACGSRTISPNESAGGFGCTRKAVSTTKCRFTTGSRNSLTATLQLPALERIKRGRSSDRPT